jgi:hypothetical protein
MTHRNVLPFFLAGGLSLAAYAQTLAGVNPADPLEMVTGQASMVDKVGRSGALELLQRARSHYALRSAGRAYDFKVTFTVNSGGQTEHDGTWTMEDVFDPKQGLRWTAKAADGYTITRIATANTLYGDDSTEYVPLRLHEARAALFDPMPSLDNMNRATLRTSTVVSNGSALTCVLLSNAGTRASMAAGRRWDETEECINPQTGLLQSHSQVPGRSYTYDYSDAVQFAGRSLPRKVTVNEAGRAVSVITVQSLTTSASADPLLFQPTESMRSKGRPIVLGGAQKMARTLAGQPASLTSDGDTICIFGLVTPTGQLREAHSLQPTNPASAAAIEAAKKLTFPVSSQPGQQVQQSFVFVMEKVPPTQ